MNPNSDKPSYRIHQLPEFEEAGHSPSYEYFLPVRDLPEADFERFGPWLKGVAGGDAEVATRALVERWRPHRGGLLGDLIEYCLEFRPNGVVVQDQKAWLLCVRPENHSTEPAIFLLPEPANPQLVRTRLDQYGFRDELLADFLCAFSGMLEDFVPNGGDLVEGAGDWRLVGNDDDAWDAEFEKMIAGYLEWHGALHFFHARNSDKLLVHPMGKVGWWIGAECRIVEYTCSFAEFCERYTGFRRQAWKKYGERGRVFAWPYDFYSSNEFPVRESN